MDKILGNGQTGGFRIPLYKTDQLMKYKNLLTKKQKELLTGTLQSGCQLAIKPARTQSGGFLGTPLASVGIPMLLNALAGKSLQNRPHKGKGFTESTLFRSVSSVRSAI